MIYYSLITAFIITFIALISPAVAQSGHPLNSVDTTPGTSVPFAPTDPTIDPAKSNDGIIRLPNSNESSEMSHDIDSVNTNQKTTSHKVSTQQQEQKQNIFPNEKDPRVDPIPVDTD